jgi:hypothetical protein
MRRTEIVAGDRGDGAAIGLARTTRPNVVGCPASIAQDSEAGQEAAEQRLGLPFLLQRRVRLWAGTGGNDLTISIDPGPQSGDAVGLAAGLQQDFPATGVIEAIFALYGFGELPQGFAGGGTEVLTSSRTGFSGFSGILFFPFHVFT